MKHFCIFVLLYLAATFSALPALADGARTPVYQGGTTLTASGHYYLTRDISVSSGSALSVDGENITVDLNGYELKTTSTSAAAMMVVDGSQDIAIENGRITGGNYGVYHSSAIVRLVIRLENLEIRNSFINGIYFDGVGQVEILNCKVTNSNTYGIRVDGRVDGFQGRLVGNRVNNIGDIGIFLEGMFASQIQKNNVSFTGSIGIQIVDNNAWTNPGSTLLIEDNVIYGAGIGLAGMFVNMPDCILRRNLVSNCISNGFYIFQATGSVLSENVSLNNGSHGFAIASTDNALLENNRAEGNGAFGLFFSTSDSCMYRNNSLRGNSSGPVSGTAADEGGNLL